MAADAVAEAARAQPAPAGGDIIKSPQDRRLYRQAPAADASCAAEHAAVLEMECSNVTQFH